MELKKLFSYYIKNGQEQGQKLKVYYSPEKLIGASVYKAEVRNPKTNKVFPAALKVYECSDEKQQKRIDRESSIYLDSDHKNVVKSLAAFKERTPDGKWMSYIVLEYCEEKDLESYLENHNINSEERRKIFRGIIRGVRYLHKSGLWHKKLHPKNILLTKEKKVKISGFSATTYLFQENMLKSYANAGIPGNSFYEFF